MEGESHHIVQILKDIGTSKIFEKLEIIIETQKDEYQKIEQDFKKLKKTYEEIVNKNEILKKEIGKSRKIVIITGIIILVTLLVVTLI